MDDLLRMTQYALPSLINAFIAIAGWHKGWPIIQTLSLAAIGAVMTAIIMDTWIGLFAGTGFWLCYILMRYDEQ